MELTDVDSAIPVPMNGPMVKILWISDDSKLVNKDTVALYVDWCYPVSGFSALFELIKNIRIEEPPR